MSPAQVRPASLPKLPGRPLLLTGLTMRLRHMKRDGTTVHAFRSSFRDRADLSRRACAEKRRRPMEAGAGVCAGRQDGKVAIKPAVAAWHPAACLPT